MIKLFRLMKRNSFSHSGHPALLLEAMDEQGTQQPQVLHSPVDFRLRLLGSFLQSVRLLHLPVGNHPVAPFQILHNYRSPESSTC